MYLDVTGAVLRQMMMHLAPLMTITNPQPPPGPGAAPAAQEPQQLAYRRSPDQQQPAAPPLPPSTNPYNGITPQYYQS